MNEESLVCKLNLRLYAIAASLVMLTTLTGCESASSVPRGDSSIYQPSTLKLKSGVPVQTVEGVYTPQADETWHSDGRYRKLEHEVTDLN